MVMVVGIGVVVVTGFGGFVVRVVGFVVVVDGIGSGGVVVEIIGKVVVAEGNVGCVVVGEGFVSGVLVAMEVVESLGLKVVGLVNGVISVVVGVSVTELKKNTV